jgi:hypothetical protein
MDLHLVFGGLTAFDFPIVLAIASMCEDIMKPKL